MSVRNTPYLVKNKIKGTLCNNFEEVEEVEEVEEIGYLEINVFRYICRTPIPFAIVRVSKLVICGTYREKGDGFFINVRLTDFNGSTPIFELPVLKKENEIYNVSVQGDGFHIAYIFDVPIYPNITTTYDVYLRHFAFEGEPDYEFILQPQMPGRENKPRFF